MASGKTFPLSLIVKAVDNATAPLAKVGSAVGGLVKSTQRAGAALSLGLTTPLVAAGAAGVLAFSRFETGLSNVSTLIDTNVESVDAIGRGVLGISKRVPVAVGDLTDALYEARSAGVSAADQFQVLEGSARLAVVGLGSTKEAIDLVTSSVKAFGLEGAEAERVYNLIFQATNTGKTTISGLAQGFGGVASTVAAAGVKLDEYLASVAALTTTGLPAAEAHTQLRAVLSGLTRQSKLTSAVFQRLGAKDVKELIRESGGLVPALERIKGVLKGNDTQMLNLLGSTEALNAVLGLTGGQAAAFKSTLDTMRNGADGVDAAFEKQNRTAAATMQRLHNQLEGVAISVGRVLVPALERLAPVLENLVTKWEGMGSEGQASLIKLAVAAAALGPTLTLLGNLAVVVRGVTAAFTFASGWAQYLWMMRASILAGLVPSLSAAAASVWAFTVSLLANPITWAIAGVVAFAGAAYLIYKNWDPIAAYFKNLWSQVMYLANEAGVFLSDYLPKLWSQAVYLYQEAWGGLTSFFSDLWGGIVGVFQAAWAKVAPIVEAVTSFFSPGQPSAFGVASLGSEQARPTLGASAAAPVRSGVQSSEARVVVDFNNMPKGARVTQAPGSTTPMDLNMGYSMVTP